MTGLPVTEIDGVPVSKIICGTNPFFGYSHFTRARDMWLRRYFTDSRIAKVLSKAFSLGINALISAPEPRLVPILSELRRKGVSMQWICTPGGGPIKGLEEGIRWCAENEVAICMPHQSYTDNNLVPARNDLIGYRKISKMIREYGMVPGLSTHRPETIVTMDKSGMDVQTYVLPFNSIGFLSYVEVEWVSQVFRRSRRPIVAIKPLAAGRITPQVGLPFVVRGIKEEDPIAIGFCSPLEVEEDVEIVLSAMKGQPSELELTTSRSKSVLEGQKDRHE